MLENHRNIRIALYLLALIAQIASLFVAGYAPELVVPFAATSTLLMGVAVPTALTNLTPKQP